jgi:hypothetical protein
MGESIVETSSDLQFGNIKYSNVESRRMAIVRRFILLWVTATHCFCNVSDTNYVTIRRSVTYFKDRCSVTNSKCLRSRRSGGCFWDLPQALILRPVKTDHVNYNYISFLSSLKNVRKSLTSVKFFSFRKRLNNMLRSQNLPRFYSLALAWPVQVSHEVNENGLGHGRRATLYRSHV